MERSEPVDWLLVPVLWETTALQKMQIRIFHRTWQLNSTFWKFNFDTSGLRIIWYYVQSYFGRWISQILLQLFWLLLNEVVDPISTCGRKTRTLFVFFFLMELFVISDRDTKWRDRDSVRWQFFVSYSDLFA